MLNYGLVLGLTSIFINLIAYAIGIHLDQDWRVGTLGFVAMIIVIVLGIKNFKSANNNLITWGQSVKIGVGISIISGLIGIIYNLIFINFILQNYDKINKLYCFICTVCFVTLPPFFISVSVLCRDFYYL